MRDGLNAAAPRKNAVPGGGDVEPDGRDDAHSGDDYPST
jgi:hypothetical protein